MYLRLRGENPDISGNDLLRSAATGQDISTNPPIEQYKLTVDGDGRANLSGSNSVLKFPEKSVVTFGSCASQRGRLADSPLTGLSWFDYDSCAVIKRLNVHCIVEASVENCIRSEALGITQESEVCFTLGDALVGR